MKQLKLWILLTAAGISINGAAGDWPNWRGPDKNGISSETAWSHEWPASGPKIAWRKDIGRGYSSISVADGRVYTMGNSGSKKIKDEDLHRDIVHCLDAETGETLWQHEYQHPLQPKYYSGGTSATPTVRDGKVYTFSKTGDVFCLNADSGDVIWTKDLVREHDLDPPKWGFAGSVVVFGDLLLLNAGTHGLALNKEDGSLAWNTGTEKAGYSTPVEYEVDGKTCITVFGEETLAGVEALTGKVLWEIKWKAAHDENIADPIILGNRMLVSSNLGKRCSLFEIKPDRLIEIWQNRNMLNWLDSSVVSGEFLYGIHAKKKSLRCLEIETGAVIWNQEGFGQGTVTLAGDRLIALTDKGKLVIAKATAEEFRELASAQVLTETCWTVPVLANGRIYARNSEGDLVCLDVRK